MSEICAPPPGEPSAESSTAPETGLPLGLQERVEQAWAAIGVTPETLQAEQVEAFAVQTHAAITDVARQDIERFQHFTQEPSHILVPNSHHEIERWLGRYYTVYPPGRHTGDSIMAQKLERYLEQRVAVAAGLAPHFPQIQHAQELGHYFQDSGLVLPTIAMRDLLAAYGDRLNILRGVRRKR